MNSGQWERFESLFSEVLKLPPDQLSSLLNEIFGDDPALRDKAASMLAERAVSSSSITEVSKEDVPVHDQKTEVIPYDPHRVAGRTIVHYRILEWIGGGGMGDVYQAVDDRLHRMVALKLLSPYWSGDSMAKLRFIQEARAVSALDHQNICTIYDIGETEEGLLFIAMAYYEGRTLKKIIEEQRLSSEQALNYALQIAKGLEIAHSHSIIHRDIKPANVIVTSDGVVKILDFGLAKMGSGLDITKTGTTMGTVGYMSPEQVRGESVDARSDQWSLGIVLYEMLTGERPFKGEYAAAILYAILNSDPTEVVVFRPDLPGPLGQVVDKMLSKKVEHRYSDMGALINDLEMIRTSPSQLNVSLPKRSPEAVASIAVLPFKNMSTDSEGEYFCEGLTEELINALAQINNLHVVGRTSSFAFREHSQKSINTIGTRLKVATVLMGSVRKSGQRIRISARLINVRSGYLMWSERYDRVMDDVFAIQDEITLAIVSMLKLKLLHVEKAALTKRPTDDLQAYQLYLKGRHHWNERTVDGLQRGITYFEKAIEQDTYYASAYSGLADCWMMSGFYGYQLGSIVYPKAKTAAQEAIRLDPSLAEAYTILGGVKAAFERDRSGAEEALKRALTLNPGSAPVLHRYAGWVLNPNRRFDEAIEVIGRALRLDPVSLAYNSVLAYTYWWAGDNEKAITQAQQTLSFNPNFWLAHTALGLAYEQQRKFTEAISSFRKAISSSRPSSFTLGMLGHTLALSGSQNEARTVLTEMQALANDQYVSAFDQAMVYVGLGELDSACLWLEKAYEEHAFWMLFLRIDPRLEPLHADARYASLLDKMGLQASVS